MVRTSGARPLTETSPKDQPEQAGDEAVVRIKQILSDGRA
jgi:hypothetical protein